MENKIAFLMSEMLCLLLFFYDLFTVYVHLLFYIRFLFIFGVL